MPILLGLLILFSDLSTTEEENFFEKSKNNATQTPEK